MALEKQDVQKISEVVATAIDKRLAPVESKIAELEASARSTPVYTPGAAIVGGGQPMTRRRAVAHYVRAVDRFEGKGLAMAAIMLAQAHVARGSDRLGGARTVPDAIEKLFGDKDLAHAVARHQEARAASFETRGISTAIGADGGFVIPEQFATEIIEILRPLSAVLSFGPRQLPLENGNLTLPRGVTGATAYYKGEAVAGTKSQPVFGQKKLDAKHLIVLVPITNQFLAMAPEAAVAFVRDDLVAAYQEKFDATLIRGAGTQYHPAGLRYLVSSANVTSASGGKTPTLTQVLADTSKLYGYVQDSNKPAIVRGGWIMAGRTERYLRDLRDGNGGKAFPEMDGGTFRGYPYRVTANVPTNLGVGGDESELYFADFDDLVIGEVPGMEVKFIPDAAYDSGGSIVAGASTDESVYRLTVSHDATLRHDTSAAVLTGVQWGAP